jgi:hypothetical protein
MPRDGGSVVSRDNGEGPDDNSSSIVLKKKVGMTYNL